MLYVIKRVSTWRAKAIIYNILEKYIVTWQVDKYKYIWLSVSLGDTESSFNIQILDFVQAAEKWLILV